MSGEILLVSPSNEMPGILPSDILLEVVGLYECKSVPKFAFAK